MKALILNGRRWQSGNGNTLHTVDIIVDGVTLHTCEPTYGYGSHYETTAAAWLVANGHLPKQDHGGPPALHWTCDKLGIAFESRIYDVPRKKDL